MRTSQRPFEFESKERLLEALASCPVKTEFHRFFGKRYDDLDQLLAYSVGLNTFRAFHHRSHGVKIGPQALYRKLARLFVEREFENWRKITTREQMHEFIIGQAEQLRNEWRVCSTGRDSPEGYDVGVGRAAKLLNLLLKYLVLWSTLSENERNQLIPLLEVPLDSYTLVGIRRVCTSVKIPKAASMGFVQDGKRYSELQNAILELCAPKFYLAHYEIAAWNASHPGISLATG